MLVWGRAHCFFHCILAEEFYIVALPQAETVADLGLVCHLDLEIRASASVLPDLST